MGELKPCPFCGGEAFTRSVNGGVLPWIIEERGGIQEKYYATCTLWCDTCGAQIEGYASSDITADGLYKRAIKNCYNAWNTRAVETCRYTENENTYILACDHCGRGMLYTPNYCPSCGRKVER